MKRLAIVASLVLFAACAPKAEEATPAADTVAAPAAPVTDSAAASMTDTTKADSTAAVDTTKKM